MNDYIKHLERQIKFKKQRLTDDIKIMNDLVNGLSKGDLRYSLSKQATEIDRLVLEINIIENTITDLKGFNE